MPNTTPALHRCRFHKAAFPTAHFYINEKGHHECREARQNARERYELTPKAVARFQRYNATERGAARWVKYDMSERGQARITKFHLTEKGMANRLLDNMRRYEQGRD